MKRIFEITGKKDLKKVWPNLELYIHGGVNFDPYLSQFQQLIQNPTMHYMETYNASEGFFAAQNNLDEDGMLLFLGHGIYYEFMPVSEYGSAHPQLLNLREVALHTQYALVISTNAGLWRYLIGDVIEFVHLHPFKIKVRGRLKAFINCCGEELMVDNTDQAILRASSFTGVEVLDYTAGPLFLDGQSRHEWIIECVSHPDDPELFVQILDTHLRELNSDYDAKRYKDMALLKPQIHFVEAGTFNSWLKTKGKLGGQHKVPRLCNDRRVLDEILS
jgi:hypothetical protein